MEFPIIELLDYENSVEWIHKHFHPDGLKCPRCEQGVEKARKYRRTQVSQVTVYRCNHCEAIYNLYTGTVIQGSQWTPMQVILLLRGIAKGESSRSLAAELELNYKTLLNLRRNSGDSLSPTGALTCPEIVRASTKSKIAAGRQITF